MAVGKVERGEPSETAHEPPTPHQRRPGAILFNLATEIDSLREPLTTLAFAASALAREPQNRELRATVARVWTQVRSILDRHSVADDHALLAEAVSYPGFRSSLVERLRARIHRLRALYAAVRQVSFEESADAEVAAAGTQLHCLTVVLDDIITAEEGEMLPMLRRLLFASKSD